MEAQTTQGTPYYFQQAELAYLLDAVSVYRIFDQAPKTVQQLSGAILMGAEIDPLAEKLKQAMRTV